MCVDLTLFPLDTIKTRLQSQQGFHKAGGFRGIYAGVPSAAVGSFPNAAAFFVTYESTKSVLSDCFSSRMAPVTHMLAASLGEIAFSTIKNALDDGVCQGWSRPLSSHYIRFIFIPFHSTLPPRAHLSSRKIPESGANIFCVPISPLRDRWHPPHVPQRISPTSTRAERRRVIYHASVPESSGLRPGFIPGHPERRHPDHRGQSVGR
ncbi:S-adenosylmethionine mitochondrial carrier protein isoform X1 [Tachysurus ichikawai]